VIDEILSARKVSGGFGLVGFHDDIFGVDPAWLAEFSEMYKRKVALPFWCNQKPDLFDKRRAKLLRDAGCVRVHLGIESGSPSIRKELLGRDISDEEIVEAFALARSLGMKTVSFNMIGLPGETEEDIMQTIRLNRKVKPGWLLYSVFYPFPGTKLYDTCIREGLIQARHIGDDYYNAEWSIDSPAISRERLQEIYADFQHLVYGR
jgi:radical SAM superfamily enzyme YgiQ (UPF0313 family)